MTFEETFYGRPNTIQAYTSLYNHHLKDIDTDWKSWSEESTLATVARWEKEGLSSNTIMSLVRLLGRYVRFMGGPAVNTAKVLQSLQRRIQQREVTVLSENEAQRLMFLARTTKPRFYPVLLLGLHAGLRRGEVFGLRCGDVDMINGKLKISHSYDGPTKSGKSRAIPMSPELAKALTDARNLLLRPTDEKVFKKFDPNAVLNRLTKQAEVPLIRFHDLRHTFASMALTSGVNPKQVSSWLGHASVVTTLSIYWNVIDEKTDLSFLPKEQSTETA